MTLAATIYGVARAARVAERLVRRSEGDPNLTDGLHGDEEGDWE